MSKEIKLSQEDLQGIFDLQQRQLALKEELAALGQARLNIKLRQVQAEKYFSVNMDLEKAIAKELEEKYGKGNINLETGTFTPVDITQPETPEVDSTEDQKEAE